MLSTTLGAELDLVHAVDVPPALWVRMSREQLTEMHRGALDRSRAALLPHVEALEHEHTLPAGSLTRRLELFPGRPARVVLDRMRELRADVLFLGPHAERGLFDFGSTTRAVLHHAEGGIWLQKGPFRPIESILVPVDLSDDSTYVLSTAVEIARRCKAEVIVLHSVDVPTISPPYVLSETIEWPALDSKTLREHAQRELDALVNSTAWGEVRHRSVVTDGPAQVAIHAMQDLAQLVVIGTRGRGGISRLVLGSVAYAVLKHARGGVLAIRRADS